ncbi:MAG: high-potential iron-sulfur protein [Parvularculaceae bacterium]|nr:high-potential iron-sulfur protein [Parvularculaceae bacterium]
MRRRAVIAVAGAAPALFLLTRRAAAEAAPACFNPDALPASQKSLRRSLGFELQSKDPKKTCAGCAFYTAKTQGCGACALFSGGPVAAASVCRNWSKKS